MGRFVSRDTELGDPTHPLSLNRFAYALDNPLSYTDPSGHSNVYDPMEVEDGARWAEPR